MTRSAAPRSRALHRDGVGVVTAGGYVVSGPNESVIERRGVDGVSVTWGEARRVQEAGPQQAWWPQGEQPQWARVTPSDLIAVTSQDDDADAVELPGLWRLDAYDGERELVTYELCLASVDGGPAGEPTFVCRDAGAVVKFRDEVTFETGDDAQPLAAWFAWLQRRDALMASEPRSDEWAGDDVDSQLERAEADVVTMGEQTALLSVFDSVAAIREWVARLSPKPLVPFEIVAFDAAGWLEAKRAQDEDGLLHQYHETSDDDPSQIVVKWLAVKPDVESAQTWFTTADGGVGSAYVWGYSEGGGQVSAFAVERALAWGEVAPFVADEFADDVPASRRWIAVRAQGMVSGIAVPVEDSFVTVSTDADGASFVFRAEEAEMSVSRRRAEQDFRLKWARWFNTDEELTRDELARGVGAVEATMKELA